MTAVATVLLAIAVAVLLARDVGGADRLARLRPRAPRSRGPSSAALACVVAGGAVALLVGLPAGALLGTSLAVAGPTVLARLEPAAVHRERASLVAELPLQLDLLAACLAGGASLDRAASVVAAALPGPGGRRFSAVVHGLVVGTPPRQAWLALADGSSDDPLMPAARLLGRAAEGGTPMAALVSRLAAEARAASLAAGSQAARRVGVLVVAPLGLCFLPAFVLIGIVPVVAGLAAPLFRGF